MFIDIYTLWCLFILLGMNITMYKVSKTELWLTLPFKERVKCLFMSFVVWTEPVRIVTYGMWYW